MNIPVLFLVFNRADLSVSVFQRIRDARPSRLFIAADGPRESVFGEDRLCRETRHRVETLIDWACEVKTLYRGHNLGCRAAVSSAIDWFFSHVEEGIILEDDTLPDSSFFRFAEALLEHYRNKPEVMHISGNNYQNHRIRGDGSYYASQFAHSWGWATWKRAWMGYEEDISVFEMDWDQISAELGFSRERAAWWLESLRGCANSTISTWDFQWHYAIMRQRGLCLLPQANLVKNIGVGATATHTYVHTNTTKTPYYSLGEINHPTLLKINPEWDEFDFRHSVMNNPFPRRRISEYLKYLLYQKKIRISIKH